MPARGFAAMSPEKRREIARRGAETRKKTAAGRRAGGGGQRQAGVGIGRRGRRPDNEGLEEDLQDLPLYPRRHVRRVEGEPDAFDVEHRTPQVKELLREKKNLQKIIAEEEGISLKEAEMEVDHRVAEILHDHRNDLENDIMERIDARKYGTPEEDLRFPLPYERRRRWIDRELEEEGEEEDKFYEEEYEEEEEEEEPLGERESVRQREVICTLPMRSGRGSQRFRIPAEKVREIGVPLRSARRRSF